MASALACHDELVTRTLAHRNRDLDPAPRECCVSPVPSLFLGIDHVGIAVADLDEGVSFYEQTFGMRKVHEETNEQQGVREVMLQIGDSSVFVQLLAPLGPDSPIAKFLERSGPGIQQMAYRVADIRSVSETLRDRGLRVLYDEPRRGTAGALVNFVHPKDAGGVLVELVEPAR
jgi:methylmalonyl-CoA/ethylmalonyl-CoA epimerase